MNDINVDVLVLSCRDPAFNDAPITDPVKLFKVQRIKPMKGNPFWEKNILQLLGVSEKVCDIVILVDSGAVLIFPNQNFQMSDVAVVKNIPEINAMLWKVKHLVDVRPIVFPYGAPTIDDINHTFLKESGECVVTKEIKFDETRMLARDEFDSKAERLDGKTLAGNSRLKWLSGYEC